MVPNEEPNPEEEETQWYLDNDRDGYHSEIRMSTTRPLGGNWISSTKGEDCDDANFEVYKLNSCGECKQESECVGSCKNKDLRHKKVSEEVKSLIDQRTQIINAAGNLANVKSFEIQEIEEGYGDINIDRYDLEIKQLPDGYSPQQLFEEIRVNFSDFITGGDYYVTKVELAPYSEMDNDTWNSRNPIGAAMDFNNSMDTSTVICTEYNYDEMYWIFSTVRSVDHLGHFVSGHREFGLEQNTKGEYSFYLRGADRLGQWVDFVANGFNSGTDILFDEAADATWKNLMKDLEEFIKKKSGAKIVPFEENRDDYAKRYDYDENDCKN